VWVLDDGAFVRELAATCVDGELDLGPMSPGEYEIALVDEDGCNQVGAGRIPVSTPLAGQCGSACNALRAVVHPCGPTRLEVEVACINTGCDDGCGGA
jgi:hypothetical protein